jgi:26S proteasome regulatory subunit N1
LRHSSTPFLRLSSTTVLIMAPKGEKDAIDISVPSKGGEPDREQEELNKNKNKNGESGKLPPTETLSEEDQELKERLETCVSTVVNKEKDASVTIRRQALDIMVTELRTATSSMTSVPKPLKFLRPHYSVLKELYATIAATSEAATAMDTESLQLRARLADVLSVLAMTMSQGDEERASLTYKLAATRDYDTLSSRPDATADTDDHLGTWGHEFVRSLAGEIGQEYSARVLAGADPDEDEPFADLLRMVDVIVPFHVTHNAEAEAVDLLIEVQRLSKLLLLENTLDESNYARICLYLIKTADYMSDPEDLAVCNTASELARFAFLLTCYLSPIMLRKCSKLRMRFFVSKSSTMMLCGSSCV